MKVLSVKQPWAWALVTGLKDIENRSWRPPASMIGQRFYIHASKTIDKYGIQRFVELGIEPVEYVLDRGAILGSVELKSVVTSSDSDWFCGPIGWVVHRSRAINPILCRGNLGLWNMPDELGVDVIEEYMRRENGKTDRL